MPVIRRYQRVCLFIAVKIACCLGALMWTAHRSAAQDPPRAAAAPDIQVEYLGADKGFAVGGQSVTMLCVLRNVGNAPLPENSASVRCYPLTGLDFLEGRLWPTIPALGPNQAVAFRWRLALTDQSTPIVFSVLITKMELGAARSAPATSGVGQSPQPVADLAVPPRIVTTSIPRFPATPHLLGVAGAPKMPQASSGKTSARLGNDRTMVNVLVAQDRVPMLSLAGKEGTEWKSVAVAFPCVRVKSAEEGQVPWPETLRVNDIDSQESKDSASITIRGSVGSNWGASLYLEAKPETGVVYGRLRLTARRTMRLYGIQLPRLLGAASPNAASGKADGSAAMLPADPEPNADLDRVAAAHIGGLTYGLTWGSGAPLTGWRSVRLGPGDAERLPVMGAEWVGDDRGENISQGATLEVPFRIFVFGPSDTVRDAARFRMP